MDTVNYRKGKFSLRKIFGKTLVRRVLVLDGTQRLAAAMVLVTDLVILKIHVVIPDLKVDPNQVDQRNVVAEMNLRGRYYRRGREVANTFVFWLAHAIISLTATRSKPPVSAGECKDL
jgi:hypothetical protein